jgi:FKBP-type peptidyl-prolyl cis-trans isomerase SlyD
MHYTHGKGQPFPAEGNSGMVVGGKKARPTEDVMASDPRLFKKSPREAPGRRAQGRHVLMAQGPQGQGVPVRVHEIKDKTVVMDFNHPLAGKTLSFDIKITEVKPAAK